MSESGRRLKASLFRLGTALQRYSAALSFKLSSNYWQDRKFGLCGGEMILIVQFLLHAVDTLFEAFFAMIWNYLYYWG